MNKNSDWYELSVWILNIFQMNGRFWCECHCQGSGSLHLTRDCFDSLITFFYGKSTKITVSEKKASKWIKDVHILHKRH